jgi:hypothetical protein
MVITARHFAKAAAQLEVLVEPLGQAVEPLGDQFARRASGSWTVPLSTLMPGTMPFLREVLGNRRAVDRLLARGLVEQDHAGEELLDARRAEKEVAVRRRFSSVHSTLTDLKRFSQVPLDSSAARMPLPFATIAAAVLDSSAVSMRVISGGFSGTGERNFT